MTSSLGETTPAGATNLATPWIVQAGGAQVGVITALALRLGRPYLCGPAATFECCPNDNLGLHAALYRAPRGSVLIGGGGGTEKFGLFGELMATDAMARGLEGLVVDGTVRDLADLDRIGFPVICAGAAPAQCAKSAMVAVGRPVTIRGVLVEPGDQIVGDRDGVVVVPSSLWADVAAAALAIAHREQGYLTRLGRGERIADILGLAIAEPGA